MRCLLGGVTAVLLLGAAAGAQRPNVQGRQADVVVTVRYDTGAAPDTAKVELLSSLGEPVSTAFTTPEGTATLSHVMADAGYTLRVSGDNIETTTKSFFLQGGEQKHPEFVTVTRPNSPGNGAGGTVSASDLNVPSRARKEFDKGEQKAATRDWNEAIQHYEKAIAGYPRYGKAYRKLGVAQLNLGDKAGARHSFEQALAIDDKYTAAHLDLGRLLYSEGDKPGAENNFTAAVATEPMNTDALTLLAAIELEVGKSAEALANAQKVHGLTTGQHAVAHFIAATALVIEHRNADATGEYNLYLQEDPSGQFAERARLALAKLQGK